MINNNDNIYSEKIIKWYLEHKRDLPWRDTKDPYKIWISEIILQQTRVIQGLDYYLRFIERFPSVDVLAGAGEDEVLKFWQGLGYYSRARNLHIAAKAVISDFGGKFPDNHKDIFSLKGVGEYTAAAIASFAFNLPYATVDGNVYRVLSRLFDIETPIDSGKGKKEFLKLAQELLSPEYPGLNNQAIMEFGALQCTPTNPNCERCPLQENCKAWELKKIQQLPVKSQKTKVTNRFFNYLFINQAGNTYLQKRTGNDIWKNLYEFPLIETDKIIDINELTSSEEFKLFIPEHCSISISNNFKIIKHVLSHRNIFARFFIISLEDRNIVLENLIKIPLQEIENYAVSRLIELFLETLDNKQGELIFP